jgi:hypothetical protein
MDGAMRDVCIGTGAGFTFGAWVSSWSVGGDKGYGHSKMIAYMGYK